MFCTIIIFSKLPAENVIQTPNLQNTKRDSLMRYFWTSPYPQFFLFVCFCFLSSYQSIYCLHVATFSGQVQSSFFLTYLHHLTHLIIPSFLRHHNFWSPLLVPPHLSHLWLSVLVLNPQVSSFPYTHSVHDAILCNGFKIHLQAGKSQIYNSNLNNPLELQTDTKLHT